MQKQIDKSEGIPDFLKVANRDKIKAPSKRAALIARRAAAEAAPVEEVDPLAVIEDPKFKAHVASEIRSGRFHLHWMEDPITLGLLRRSVEDKAVARAEALAKLKALPKPERAVRPVFGTGIRIMVVKEPVRKEGSARTSIWNAMKEFIKRNPSASVADVFAKTEYKKADFDRDLKLKNIKTDLIKATEPVKVEAKPEVAPEPKKIERKPPVKVLKKVAKKKGKK